MLRADSTSPKYSSRAQQHLEGARRVSLVVGELVVRARALIIVNVQVLKHTIQRRHLAGRGRQVDPVQDKRMLAPA